MGETKGLQSESLGSGSKKAPKLSDAQKKAVEDFKKKIKGEEGAEEKAIEDLDEKFEKIKITGKDLDQSAISRLDGVHAKQVKEIREFFDNIIKQYEAKIAGSKGDYAKIATEVLSSAEKETKVVIDGVAAILVRHSSKEGEVSTEDVRKIEESITTLNKFAKQNPDVPDIANRIFENNLTDSDYNKIIGFIDVNQLSSVSSNSIETSCGGTFLSMMTTTQIKELVKRFGKSEKQADTLKLINVLISIQKISKKEADELMQETVAMGVITGDQKSEYQNNWDSGQYQKTIEESRQKARKALSQKGYSGMGAENIMNKVMFKKPMWAAIAMVWGTTTFAMNMLANRQKGDKLGDYLSRAAKSYALPGLGVAVLGYEVAGTATKTNNRRTVGAGGVSLALNSPDGEENPLSREAFAQQSIAQIYDESPKSMRDYLRAGGIATILERREYVLSHKGTKRQITLDDLIAMEKEENHEDQVAKLIALRDSDFVSKERTIRDLTTLSEAASQAGIKDTTGLLAVVGKKDSSTKIA